MKLKQLVILTLATLSCTATFAGKTVSYKDSIQSGETYLFIDQLLTEEGPYSCTIPAVGGGDSTINLTLKFFTPCQDVAVTVADSIFLGDSYLFIDTLITPIDLNPVVVTRTIPRVAGCDSTITLTLNVMNPCSDTTVAYTDSIYVGDSYLFIDTLITPIKADTTTCQRTISRIAGCDSTINLTLIAMRVQKHDTLNKYVWDSLCYQQEFVSRRQTVYPLQDTVFNDTILNARKELTDTFFVTIDSIYRYNLKVWPKAIDSLKKDTILEDSLPYKWKPAKEEHVYYEAGTYHDVAMNMLRCDSIRFTLELKVIAHDTIEVIVPDSNLCDGDVYKSRRQELTMVGREEIFDTTFNDTIKSKLVEPLQMNDTIYKYHLYVWPKTKYPEVFKDTIDNDKWPYIWNVYAKSVGDTVKETITEGGPHFYHRKNILDCDSIIYELNLAVRTVETRYATPVDSLVCKGTEYVSRLLPTHIINGLTEWQDSLRVWDNVNLLAIDSIYTYKVDTLVTTVPNTEMVGVKAYCDYEVDYTEPLDNVTKYIETNTAFAEVLSTTWEVETKAGWKPITTIVTSDDQTVRVRVTIETECTTTTAISEPYEVKTATGDDKEELNIPSAKKYGNRIVMVDRNATEALGWTIAEEDVTWYEVVGDIDDRSYDADPALWNDKVVKTGSYYYTLADGQPLVGQFYALIPGMKAAMTCGTELRTEVLDCKPTSKAAVHLAPNMVAPGETMELIGLDANESYAVRVIGTNGQTEKSFTVEAQETVSLKAAMMPGMYLVNVMNESENVSLKYIVK